MQQRIVSRRWLLLHHVGSISAQLPADKGVYSESEFGKAPSAPPGAGGGEPAEDIREMLPRPLNDVVVAIVEDDADMSAQIQALDEEIRHWREIIWQLQSER